MLSEIVRASLIQSNGPSLHIWTWLRKGSVGVLASVFIALKLLLRSPHVTFPINNPSN